MCRSLLHLEPLVGAEEWLCWPCRMYEEQQRAAGVPQDEVSKGSVQSTRSALGLIRTHGLRSWRQAHCCNMVREQYRTRPSTTTRTVPVALIHTQSSTSAQVRPKRWEMEARGITHAELPGGSHAVSCCLCPVRNGAFKRTTDGKNWCHVVGATGSRFRTACGCPCG